MQAFQPNEETGFLESNPLSSFNSALKVKFLDLAKSAADNGDMPNIPGMCSAVGINPRTFYTHLNRDGKFKEAWEDIIDYCESTLVRTMFARGRTPGGYMDRITWLRAYRPERWNPELKLNVHHDYSDTKGLIDDSKQAIEAEIVQNTPPLIEGT
jgi:hypothetical protein